MSESLSPSPAPSLKRKSPVLAIGSLLAPVGGVVIALIFATAADGLAVIGWIVIAVVGSGLAGTALAVSSLIRRERWLPLGILGLLINTVPSIALFIAIVVQRSQM